MPPPLTLEKLPMNWSPTGSPSLSPHGTLSAGSPATAGSPAAGEANWPFSGPLKDGSTFTLKQSTVDKLANGEPINGIDWDAEVTNSYNQQAKVNVREIGLGRYTATIPLADEQQLTLRLLDRDFDVLKALHWRRPYPAEYSLAQPASPALEQLMEFHPSMVREGLQAEPQRKAVAHYAYFTALVLLLTGILLRRL
jgi:hypothetical protein